MIKVKLADVVVQVHIRDEYSWQRVLYCPWVNCKYYNDANNGITYSIKNLEDFFENEEYLAKNRPFKPEYNSTYWYLAPSGDYCSKCFLGDARDLLLMEAGFCFKTKREAIDNKEKTIKIWSDIKDKYK